MPVPTLSNALPPTMPGAGSSSHVCPSALPLNNVGNGTGLLNPLAYAAKMEPGHRPPSCSPITPTALNVTGTDAVDQSPSDAQRVAGMDHFGDTGASDGAQVSSRFRQAQLASPAPDVYLRQVRVVDMHLAPVKIKIREDLQSARQALQRDHRDVTQVTDVYASKDISNSRRLTFKAVDAICKTPEREKYRTALKENTQHRGAMEVRKACLALSLASKNELHHSKEVAALHAAIDAYLRVDGKNLVAVTHALGGGGGEELKAVTAALSRLTDAIGLATLRQDILAASVPAVADALEKKGHPLTAESLAAAFNPQALGSFLSMSDSAAGLLEMADTLPELMDDAAPTRSAGNNVPADQARPGVTPNRFPEQPTAAPQPQQPVINFSPVISPVISPMFTNAPWRGGEIEVSMPDGPRFSPALADHLSSTDDSSFHATKGLERTHPASVRRTSSSSTESEARLISELDDALEIEDLDDGDSRRAEELPRMSGLNGNMFPRRPDSLFDEDEPSLWSVGVMDPEPAQRPAKEPVHAASVHSDGGRFQPAGSQPRIVPQPPQPPMHVRSYLRDLNPGLRRAGGMGNNTLFQMNIEAYRDNIPAGSRVRAERGVVSAEESSKPAKVMPEASNSLPQVTHRGRGAERDGDVRIVPDAMKSPVPRSG